MQLRTKLRKGRDLCLLEDCLEQEIAGDESLQSSGSGLEQQQRDT